MQFALCASFEIFFSFLVWYLAYLHLISRQRYVVQRQRLCCLLVHPRRFALFLSSRASTLSDFEASALDWLQGNANPHIVNASHFIRIHLPHALVDVGLILFVLHGARSRGWSKSLSPCSLKERDRPRSRVASSEQQQAP